ncbi:hypothetical protein ACH5RR_006921 [Cinchona calisaya]|uniref:Uncharacterized protein n=1 Tax=Cinchona calisaya TaxID=153742 RepID=A0ABD3AQD5_9GENT
MSKTSGFQLLHTQNISFVRLILRLEFGISYFFIVEPICSSSKDVEVDMEDEEDKDEDNIEIAGRTEEKDEAGPSAAA